MTDRPEVVVATSNPGKVREIREILEGVAIELRGLEHHAPVVFPQEGDDYVTNALEKARAAARSTGCVALADDSGLEVRALGGAPGARSARYGGPGLDDHGRILKLLRDLEGASVRAARFVCIAAVAAPDGSVAHTEGTCPGRILEAPRGCSGFGYDPVFLLEGDARTLAELASDEKNRVSHRGRAFRALVPEILARTK